MSSEQNNANSLIRQAFFLGWTLLELKDRVQIEAQSDQTRAWTVALWQTLFRRIALLQMTLSAQPSPGNPTGIIFDPTNTLFDVSDSYLPDDGAAYTRFGIPAPTDDPGDPFTRFKTFKLYNCARRTLNCLALLSLKSDDYLAPQQAENSKMELVSHLKQMDEKIVDHAAAVQFLLNRLISLLDAWDSYLHTAFYLEQGSLANQIKVSAYQAGHSMAAFSWDTSLKREKLEQQKGSGQEHVDPQILYKQVWQETCSKGSVHQAQSQVMMLSKALDDAYVPPTSGTSEGSTTAPPTDIQKPDVMLTAISASLEYWLRAIEWFEHGRSEHFTSDFEQSLYTALLQQANIWQSLLLGQQTLQIIANQSVTNEILNDFMKSVEDTIGQDIARSFVWVVRTVKRTFFAGLPVLLLAALWVLLIIFLGQFLPLPVFYKNLLTSLLSALGVVGGFFASQAQKINIGSDLTTIVNTLDSTGSAFLTTYQSGYQHVQNEFADLNYNVSVASPLVHVFIEYFHKRKENALNNENTVKDKNNLNNENTVKNENALKNKNEDMYIKDNYDFLIFVVWTNQERVYEIEEIVRSAFGAIGVLVGSMLAPITIERRTRRSSQRLSPALPTSEKQKKYRGKTIPVNA